MNGWWTMDDGLLGMVKVKMKMKMKDAKGCGKD